MTDTTTANTTTPEKTLTDKARDVASTAGGKVSSAASAASEKVASAASATVDAAKEHPYAAAGIAAGVVAAVAGAVVGAAKLREDSTPPKRKPAAKK